MRKGISHSMDPITPIAQASADTAASCIFCRIAKGEIPAKKVHEDEKVVVALDLYPAAPGHMIIIPKAHHLIMPQLPDDIVKHISVISKKLCTAALKGLNCTGVDVFIANGAAAGQKAPHFLAHVIPRYANDGVNFNLPEIQIKDDELRLMHEMIKPYLSDQVQAPQSTPPPLQPAPAVANVPQQAATQPSSIPAGVPPPAASQPRPVPVAPTQTQAPSPQPVPAAQPRQATQPTPSSAAQPQNVQQPNPSQQVPTQAQQQPPAQAATSQLQQMPSTTSASQQTQSAPIQTQQAAIPQQPEKTTLAQAQVVGQSGQAQKKFTQEQLMQVIDANPQLKELLITQPQTVKAVAAQNQQIASLFAGYDIDEISNLLKNAAPKNGGIDLDKISNLFGG